MTKNTFYITTAISYPNGKPHIGHAYEAICTDAIARFYRLMGHDVMFLTGTDEHGLKMEQTARKEGIETRALADRNSALFRDMCDQLKISYDRFIRTTDEDHKAMCQMLWQRMEAAGDIYLDRYEGWYSVRDEAYYDESELTDGEGGIKLAPTGTPVEWTVEESYFFRLSKYADKLLELYEKQPDFICPDGRRNEIMSFVKTGLRDLSISRTSFKWGVPVPGDDRHVMYVWVDALTNYLSATGWPDGDKAHYWPADVHVIGKDIVRFHTVYWPAFLMSAGIPLPKQVFGHGFLLSRGGEKLSKSAGNTTDLTTLVNQVGADAVRYYCLRKVPFGDDGGYSLEDIIQTYNSDLANSFGNLVQRVFSFIAKNLEGRVPRGPDDRINAYHQDVDFLETLKMHLGQVEIEFDNMNLDHASAYWMEAVYAANRYVDQQAPWTLKKTNPERMEKVLAVLLIAIRHLAIYLQPIAPASARKVISMFGTSEQLPISENRVSSWAYKQFMESGFTLQPPTPVFPKLELPVSEGA